MTPGTTVEIWKDDTQLFRVYDQTAVARKGDNIIVGDYVYRVADVTWDYSAVRPFVLLFLSQERVAVE